MPGEAKKYNSFIPVIVSVLYCL